MNVQTIAKRLGESGCYFISLLRLVKSENIAISLYRQALHEGFIDADCFVRDPAGVLRLAAGGRWSVRHEDAEYQPKSDELEILRFERQTTGATLAHFVVGDGKGGVAYDPLDLSQTVVQGRLVSKRIVKRLA